MPAAPVVSIARITGSIEKSLYELLQPFESEVRLSGRSVLIKPNLVEPLPCTSGQTTNPDLVEAIIVWCKKAGAKKIAVGEGPSYFQPRSALRRCFTDTGTARAAERQGVEWILFDEGPMRVFTNHSPALPARFALSEHAFAWDCIINVPVPKTHYLTTVSIAMKNLKGFIRREDKPSFHYCGKSGIHGSVTELNRMIRPALNIIDCTAPLHRNAGFLLAATDIVAADAVTASLMGMDPSAIETVRLGHAAGLGEMDLARIDIQGEDVKELSMNFEQPEAFIRRTFPALTLYAEKACSGCLIPLFHALHRFDREGLLPHDQSVVVCGPASSCTTADRIVYLGRCTEAAGRRPCLPACPPAKEEVYEFLKQHLL